MRVSEMSASRKARRARNQKKSIDEYNMVLGVEDKGHRRKNMNLGDEDVPELVANDSGEENGDQEPPVVPDVSSFKRRPR
eukprot:12414524-Karenia_brevis.AAC.1